MGRCRRGSSGTSQAGRRGGSGGANGWAGAGGFAGFGRWVDGWRVVYIDEFIADATQGLDVGHIQQVIIQLYHVRHSAALAFYDGFYIGEGLFYLSGGIARADKLAVPIQRNLAREDKQFACAQIYHRNLRVTLRRGNSRRVYKGYGSFLLREASR